MSKHTVWGTVSVIGLILSALVILSLNDKPTQDLLVVVVIAVLPALAAFGVSIKKSLEEVKEISNGNLTKERALSTEMLRMLAETHPSITTREPFEAIADRSADPS